MTGIADKRRSAWSRICSKSRSRIGSRRGRFRCGLFLLLPSLLLSRDSLRNLRNRGEVDPRGNIEAFMHASRRTRSRVDSRSRRYGSDGGGQGDRDPSAHLSPRAWSTYPMQVLPNHQPRVHSDLGLSTSLWEPKHAEMLSLPRLRGRLVA